MELVALFICDRLWQQVYAQISFSEKTLNFYIDARDAPFLTRFSKKLKNF